MQYDISPLINISYYVNRAVVASFKPTRLFNSLQCCDNFHAWVELGFNALELRAINKVNQVHT